MVSLSLFFSVPADGGRLVKIATPTDHADGQLRPRPSSSPSSFSKTMACADPSSSSCLSWGIRPWRHPGTVIEICSENIGCASVSKSNEVSSMHDDVV